MERDNTWHVISETEGYIVYYDVTKPVTVQANQYQSGLGAVILQDGNPISSIVASRTRSMGANPGQSGLGAVILQDGKPISSIVASRTRSTGANPGQSGLGAVILGTVNPSRAVAGRTRSMGAKWEGTARHFVFFGTVPFLYARRIKRTIFSSYIPIRHAGGSGGHRLESIHPNPVRRAARTFEGRSRIWIPAPKGGPGCHPRNFPFKNVHSIWCIVSVDRKSLI